MTEGKVVTMVRCGICEVRLYPDEYNCPYCYQKIDGLTWSDVLFLLGFTVVLCFLKGMVS